VVWYHSIGLAAVLAEIFTQTASRPHPVRGIKLLSLKGDLSNATTFKFPLFSLDNTFNASYIVMAGMDETFKVF
jgi:hypothetical protein